jgi:hypothetical protein
MTIKHKTKINGFECEVDIDHDDDPISQGWITKGSYSSSMARAFMNGYITSSDGEQECEVPDSILHRIENWAESVGY